jgi:transposase-like protein
MAIPSTLRNVILSHPCPHCQHPRSAKGSYFSSVRKYKCAACNEEVLLDYPTKLVLFRRHLEVTTDKGKSQ